MYNPPVDLGLVRIAARHHDIDFGPIPFVFVLEIIEGIKEIILDHDGTEIIRRIAVKYTDICSIREPPSSMRVIHALPWK